MATPRSVIRFFFITIRTITKLWLWRKIYLKNNESEVNDKKRTVVRKKTGNGIFSGGNM